MITNTNKEYDLFIINTKRLILEHENKIKKLEDHIEYIMKQLHISYINDNYLLL